ncbi:MAG: formate--tetrahydrofolate ligase, partial [Clostridiales bacterium]|nr:formate--tetrahydrofolate ligase [Clostridiales bacterium]
GAEKFIDIKCRMGGISPDAVVLVATVRALKYHGGIAKENLTEENVDALKAGLTNLGKHIENIQNLFKLNVVVAINKFSSDTQSEMEEIKKYCTTYDVEAVLADGWDKGGAGMCDLAKQVIKLCDNNEQTMEFIYDTADSIKKKMEMLSKYYGAGSVEYTERAEEDIRMIQRLGLEKLPICVAKTQYSLSTSVKKLGRPEGFNMKVRRLFVSSGAGFIVIATGSILRMPGLPKVPSANSIDINEDDEVVGLF